MQELETIKTIIDPVTIQNISFAVKYILSPLVVLIMTLLVYLFKSHKAEVKENKANIEKLSRQQSDADVRIKVIEETKISYERCVALISDSVKETNAKLDRMAAQEQVRHDKLMDHLLNAKG